MKAFKMIIICALATLMIAAFCGCLMEDGKVHQSHSPAPTATAGAKTAVPNATDHIDNYDNNYNNDNNNNNNANNNSNNNANNTATNNNGHNNNIGEDIGQGIEDIGEDIKNASGAAKQVNGYRTGRQLASLLFIVVKYSYPLRVFS